MIGTRGRRAGRSAHRRQRLIGATGGRPGNARRWSCRVGGLKGPDHDSGAKLLAYHITPTPLPPE